MSTMSTNTNTNTPETITTATGYPKVHPASATPVNLCDMSNVRIGNGQGGITEAFAAVGGVSAVLQALSVQYYERDISIITKEVGDAIVNLISGVPTKASIFDVYLTTTVTRPADLYDETMDELEGSLSANSRSYARIQDAFGSVLIELNLPS